MNQYRRAFRRVAREDDGVSLVLAAVAMVAIVAMAAFAVDVGRLYAERRELQNAADAIVLAIAEDCGHGEACDSGSATATANSYADLNASDNAAAIHALDLDLGAQEVSVTTKTEEADGGTVLAPLFARVIGFEGSTVGASASALWGFPKSAHLDLPIIISECEWSQVSGLIQDPQTDASLYSGSPATFLFHDGNTTEDCNAEAGQDVNGDERLDGGFGWLQTVGDCSAEVAEDEWVGQDPGASPPQDCDPGVIESKVLNQIILIPYFYDICEPQDDSTAFACPDQQGAYLVKAFGAIHVTGYNFGGQYKAPSAAGAPCSGDERCLAGFITTATIFDGDVGGTDHGVVIVKLTG